MIIYLDKVMRYSWNSIVHLNECIFKGKTLKCKEILVYCLGKYFFQIETNIQLLQEWGWAATSVEVPEQTPEASTSGQEEAPRYVAKSILTQLSYVTV